MLKKLMNKNKIIANKIKNKIKMVKRDKQIKIRNHKDKDKDKWLIKINKLNKNRKNNKILIKIKP